MSIFLSQLEDKVFAEATVIDDGVSLKDPKPYREAYLITEFARRMNPTQIASFAKSKHAQALVENEIISYNALEDLARGAYSDRSEELMVCHMAAENDDDRWNELVAHRAEERRILDDLMRDYGAEAQTACKRYNDDFVNKYVPGDCRGDDCEHGGEGHSHGEGHGPHGGEHHGEGHGMRRGVIHDET